VRVLLGIVIASAGVSPAAADKAFCNVTPCDQREITTRTLDKDLPVGPVTCKKGKEAGEDAQKRVVYCTIAKTVTVDGMTVKAGAYTLFHPNGKIYQTTMAKPFERTLADGSKVTCAADLVSLEPNGALTYCDLGAARAGKPRPRVGEGIVFYPDGKLRAYTLDEPYTAAGISLIPGSSVSFDDKGRLIGGWLKDPVVAGALTIDGDFQVWPNGKLRMVHLEKAAKIQGHEFPQRAKLGFRDDGTLAAAEYIEKQGFMIHGEPWHDTRYMTFDKAGKVLTSYSDHYQAKEGPGQFRERLKRERDAKGKKP
jgi:hypothetical protein